MRVVEYNKKTNASLSFPNFPVNITPITCGRLHSLLNSTDLIFFTFICYHFSPDTLLGLLVDYVQDHVYIHIFYDDFKEEVELLLDKVPSLSHKLGI